jgi:hypothetical protein
VTAFLMQKHLGRLQAVDDVGQQYLSKIRQGETFLVEIKRARNPRQHRLYWALCGIVADNSDKYQDAEQVSMALKIATGHVIPHINPADGRTYWIPKSIAFHAMPQDEFAPFFDKCIAIVASRFLPGVTDAELRAELESMTQGRAA